MFTNDAPTLALNFLRTAQTYIEPGIYARAYPDFQYRELVPVDNTAPEWIKQIEFFSMGDDMGEAREFAAEGDDIPFVDFQLDKGDSRVTMAAIGYRYNLEEVAHAQQYGLRLTDERADAARRAYERYVDNTAFLGRPKLGKTGLVNSANVTILAAPTGDWADPATTVNQIVADVNKGFSTIFIGSNGIEQADTMLIPQTQYEAIATRRIDNTSEVTILQHILRTNVFTMRTGRAPTIRAVWGLETAGAGGTTRAVFYRRDPAVVKLHIPMPLRWLEAEKRLLKFEIPGIFRLGGVEVRRPGAMLYMDGV